MVVKRKNKFIDGKDRDIIRNLHKSRRPLTANQLSKNIKLTPSAIRPRLDNLKSKGIVKKVNQTGLRTFTRSFKTKKGIVKKRINAPRSIHWGIDLKKKNHPKNMVKVKKDLDKMLIKNRKLLLELSK